MSIAFYWKEKAAIVTFLIITINNKKIESRIILHTMLLL